MIDVSIRLRRAIQLNDLVLVKRILKNNPKSIRNPDLDDKCNTSLHLASKLGFLEIAEFLVDAGHEDDGIARNADWDTPLMLAVESQEAVATMLATRFPRCIAWKNKRGEDALMLASRHGASDLLTCLLTLAPDPSALLAAADNDGNIALHYASAYGQLKAIRTLLYAGADPMARNAYSWTPISYSSTVAAEVYFRNLVAEFERRKVQEEREEREIRRREGAGLRLVIGDEEEDAVGEQERGEGRRAMTPTVGRSEGWGFAGLRARASSGE